MQHLHLTHPRLDFYVDVTFHEGDGRFLATANLAEDSHDVRVGDTPQEAVRAALKALGEPYASKMAVGGPWTPSIGSQPAEIVAAS